MSKGRAQLKYEEDERFLAKLNRVLQPIAENEYRELDETWPTVHIVGLPRSGTTVALQLLAAHTNLRFIDHIAAAFWQAPTFGLRLSQHLARGRARESTFSSTFGRTADVFEPHEFGYFWADLLGIEELQEPRADHIIDWPRVRRVMTNMCATAKAPIVFKSFHLLWLLKEFRAALPKTVFVIVRRDLLDIAMSILHMRRERFGNDRVWAGLRPRNYDDLVKLPAETQVAGQVFYLNQSLDQSVEGLPSGCHIEWQYEDIIADPSLFTESVIEAVREHIPGVRGEGVVPRKLERPDGVRTGERERERVRRALEAFLGAP